MYELFRTCGLYKKNRPGPDLATTFRLIVKMKVDSI